MNLKTRREFLRSSILGGALTWTVPSFLAETFAQLHAQNADRATPGPTGKDSTIFVLLQLAGGNDGLNTVVPYANDYYLKARPSLALRGDKVLKLNDEFGLHPGLAGFQELYDQGHFSMVHGVGYPNPNRSHFRSTEIWQTGSDANQAEKYGWIGRYFDHACQGADPAVGIALGSQMPQAFAGKHRLGITLQNPENYRFASGGENGMAAAVENSLKEMNRRDLEPSDAAEDTTIGTLAGAPLAGVSPLDYLERTALDAQLSSEKILALSKKVRNQSEYPNSALANSFKLIARLIGGGMPTRVYYLSQGGYDTHTNQASTQERLLRDLGGSVKAFVEDLKAQGNFSRVLLMTFSEFGRRVSQNANGGTDHGAAAPLFLVSEKMKGAKGGLLGRFPSLAPADLHNGDIRYTTDFRTVYAAILENWLRIDSQPVLKKKFKPFASLT